MNLPNKLTFFRVLLIPIMVIVAYIDYLNVHEFVFDISLAEFIMCAIFTIASLTDFLDGYLARKNNQVTTFGKFADPLADKILVMAALLILMSRGLVYAWVCILILAREFLVTGVRLLAIEHGKVIAASKLGKYKTASTMVSIILLFFHAVDYLHTAGDIMMYVALALTVISGIDYLYKNRGIIFESV